MRFVLVHNHIFKNAGSTVDHLFERAGFVNTRMEATPESSTVYPSAIVEAVQRDPSIEYVSSHVLRAPRPPDAEDLRIRAELGEERYAFVERANRLDLELHRFAWEELLRRRALLLESTVSMRQPC
jgi:hypothetical protein